MKACLTLLILLLALGRGFGQQILVAGRVLDAQQAAVPFATVLLTAVADSAVVETSRADEQGRYELRVKQGGPFWVQATAVGFGEGRSAAFTVRTGSVRVPDLRLPATAQELGEVQVVGRKPLLEMQAGKIVVNMAGSLTAGATALEALRKVPGLVVMSNRISIAGREGVII